MLGNPGQYKNQIFVVMRGERGGIKALCVRKVLLLFRLSTTGNCFSEALAYVQSMEVKKVYQECAVRSGAFLYIGRWGMNLVVPCISTTKCLNRTLKQENIIVWCVLPQS